MSKLLIDDYPILVLPKLATEIGLNEAIVLQQIHYWLGSSKHIHDGFNWIYNSYKEWEEQFPFWSNVTIRRTITSLEKQNLIITSNYNKAGFDKTKWYTINYLELEGVSKRVAQNEQTMWSKRANGFAQNEQVEQLKMSKPIPETTQETTSETSSRDILSGDPTASPIPYKEIIGYLNEKAGKQFKHNTGKSKRCIEARWNEDFRLDDFKKVIDIKTSEWLGTSQEKYLRPETLFGTKFEGYLNQETNTQPNNPYANAFENAQPLDMENLPF
ncbi:MAG: conserved phage C-terminal domain-containing protein [Staphylococcus warneri]|uniref:conserved phage C-terminal domain-containing protein n=1 Tax=Staphylococcus warneri TaxID=1292 RepID=UPI0009A4D301|nr:conserved phage C-terminal domain-containing protein [Staphylococcus warneri]MCM3482285.1 conserved phage C-terminal domain-containing protein [Staphylococcus warneri]MCT1632295.1 conserved phage C-terminal domain-containing protein [Staphylococcus warneri]MCT2348228.1 conserved phage C-terminal domain-containing protein [Staphylococcus warneri]MCV7476698.1 conserved phage C-terminal domain-containing protein [Staphylococcus warneri]MDK8516407.1 conserved phage C-terminal domain-containing 